jgi:hypothetical protein
MTAAGASRRKAETPANIGRPRMPYDPQIGAYVLDELAKGQRSLRAICEAEELPDRSVIFGWVLDNEEFAIQYSRARELQQHGLIDDTIDIADTEKDTNRARVRIAARQWHAGKLLPKVYGDFTRVDQTVTTTPGDPALFEKMTPEERDTVRSILTAAMQREQPKALAQGVVINGRES